jgi:hypothetical protein
MRNWFKPKRRDYHVGYNFSVTSHDGKSIIRAGFGSVTLTATGPMTSRMLKEFREYIDNSNADNADGRFSCAVIAVTPLENET